LNTPITLVDGTCPPAANNNSEWWLPDEGIYGWNSGLPCCPFGSWANDPCSDRIFFGALVSTQSVQITSGSTTSNYVLQIRGMKAVQSPSGTPVNEFISQEQQNSQAYLYARLSVQCVGNAQSCQIPSSDLTRQCLYGSCASSGVCNYKTDPTKAGQPCTATVQYPQCQTPVCVSGVCTPVMITGSNGWACNSSLQNPPVDSCANETCVNGICTVLPTNEATCTERNAILGVYSAQCTYAVCGGSNPSRCVTRVYSASCTPPAGVAFNANCSKGTCKSKTYYQNGVAYSVGSCAVIPTYRSGVQVSNCNPSLPTCQKPICAATSGYPAGSCTVSLRGTSYLCGTQPTTQCQKSVCNGAGQCAVMNLHDGTSCTSLTAPSSSCTLRQCQSGNCAYVVGNNGATGSCKDKSYVTCQRRLCYAAGTSLTTGSFWKCGYTNMADGGSCVGNFPQHICYQRLCENGVCTKVAASNYQPSWGTCLSSPTLGTSNASAVPVSPVTCYSRLCNTTTGACTTQPVKTKSTSCSLTGSPACYTGVCSIGTCSSRPLNGTTCGSLPANGCQTAFCLAGVCTTQNLTAGSCKTYSVTPSPNACIKRSCSIGVCTPNYQNGANCISHLGLPPLNVAPYTSYVPACVVMTCNNNGTCLVDTTTNNNKTCDNSNPCNPGTCWDGSCVYTHVPDGSQPAGCSGTVGDCQMKQCSGGVCVNVGNPSTFGGSCKHDLAAQPCNNRICSASTGQCHYFYNGATTPSPSNSGCQYAQCGNLTSGAHVGKGSYISIPSQMDGLSCGVVPEGACFVQQCVSGVCQYRSNPSAAGASCDVSLHCSLARRGLDYSNHGYSHSRLDFESIRSVSGRSNPPINPPIQGPSPCQTMPAVDAPCYTYQCNSGGQCLIQPINDNVGCGPDPQPGTYSCEQYVCRNGTCNTTPGSQVPIDEGQYCSGYVPCDPTSTYCNSECQEYVCINGACVFNTREGLPCKYPKPPSYKRTSSRDSGGAQLLPVGECQTSVCSSGLCSVTSKPDGVTCGAQNNSCINNTCLQGSCVEEAVNCSWLVPPSKCFDVTCDASSGECVLKLNGVVDCTCIDNCDGCLSVDRAVPNAYNLSVEFNETVENGACWWCPDNPGSGCYNRINFETGQPVVYVDSNGNAVDRPYPSCFSDHGQCSSGGGGLSGGGIAGVVVAAVVASGLGVGALGAALLVARMLKNLSAVGEDAVLTDVAFELNAADNPFHQSKWTTSDLTAGIAADQMASGYFITN
jgi:hypothetical protein